MNNELYHYGILGMRWGVRKNPYGTYKKASVEFDKRSATADKYQGIAVKKMMKADSKRYSLFTSSKKVAKYDAAAQKAQHKANKKTKRAADWYKAMDKTFANTNIKLTKEQIARGEEFIERLRKASSLRYALK